MRARRFAMATTVALAVAACDGAIASRERKPSAREYEAAVPMHEPWSPAWLLAEGERYLGDAGFRRRALEASLVNPENLYSRTRLSAYGRRSFGWDVLPEWTPSSAPIDMALAKRLAGGEPLSLPAAAKPVWDGERPTTLEGWIALGRRVFFSYPLRPEVFAEHALAHPAVAREVGLHPAADGTYPGLVAFRDVDGSTQVGITCALCHSAIEDGVVVEGRARRELDYGRMGLAFHRTTGAAVPDELAARMATWGPGRADITEDDDQDPVAIPDLWGIRWQSALTQAGTLRHTHPAALAIRQETQILHANRERTRPPRELAWALAMFVYAIETPPPPRVASPLLARGGEVFDSHCARCHDNAAKGGDPIAAEQVGTDPALAFGTARGTGMYRPAPLLRVADAAPYLHHGVVASLEELLSQGRFAPDYDRGARGAGPIAGHVWGTELAPPDRAALLVYLRTL
jgi:cytochrome c5